MPQTCLFVFCVLFCVCFVFLFLLNCNASRFHVCVWMVFVLLVCFCVFRVCFWQSSHVLLVSVLPAPFVFIHLLFCVNPVTVHIIFDVFVFARCVFFVCVFVSLHFSICFTMFLKATTGDGSDSTPPVLNQIRQNPYSENTVWGTLKIWNWETLKLWECKNWNIETWKLWNCESF